MNIFYPNAISAADQAAFMRNALYPTALQIAAKLKLFVTKVDVGATGRCMALFGDEAGFNHYLVNFYPNSSKANKDEYSAGALGTPDCSDYSDLCKTEKSAYALRKIGKDWAGREEVYKNTKRLLSRAVVQGVNKHKWQFENDYPKFNWVDQLNNHNVAVLQMVEIALGHIKVDDLHPTARPVIEQKYQAYKDYLAVKDVTQQQRIDVLRGTKYMFCVPRSSTGSRTLDRTGIQFAVVNFDNWANSLHISKDAEAPKEEEFSIIEPMRWYPSFRDIPQQYCDEVLAKLTFAKLARETNGTAQRIDPDGFAPPHVDMALYPEVNMFAWRRGYSNTSNMWFLIDKN